MALLVFLALICLAIRSVNTLYNRKPFSYIDWLVLAALFLVAAFFYGDLT